MENWEKDIQEILEGGEWREERLRLLKEEIKFMESGLQHKLEELGTLIGRDDKEWLIERYKLERDLECRFFELRRKLEKDIAFIELPKLIGTLIASAVAKWQQPKDE